MLIELSLRQRYGETFIAHFFNVRRFHFQSRINPTGCISLNASVIASAIILWSERINTVYCYFTESSNIPKFSGNLQLHVGLIDWTHATHCHFHHACQFNSSNRLHSQNVNSLNGAAIGRSRLTIAVRGSLFITIQICCLLLLSAYFKIKNSLSFAATFPFIYFFKVSQS